MRLAFSLMIAFLSHSSFAMELTPIQDTFVVNGSPNTIYGNRTFLDVRRANAFRATLIEFDLSNVESPVTSATLSLFVSRVKDGGQVSIRNSRESWSEETTSYNTIPRRFGNARSISAEIDGTDVGSYIAIDLTDVIQEAVDNSEVTFGLYLSKDAGTPSLNVRFSSKEGDFPPRLEVEHAGDDPVEIGMGIFQHITTQSPEVVLDPTETLSGFAQCPRGDIATGGGYRFSETHEGTDVPSISVLEANIVTATDGSLSGYKVVVGNTGLQATNPSVLFVSVNCVHHTGT